MVGTLMFFEPAGQFRIGVFTLSDFDAMRYDAALSIRRI